MSDMLIAGMPGVSAEKLVSFRRIFRGAFEYWLPGGKQIDGTYSRDPGNTGNINVLRPGLVMGKRSSGGTYAPSIIGLTGGALTGIATSLTIPAEVSTEMNRRFGASGTFKLTGPPGASGVVRTSTITYSALGATTATITAAGVNEVQKINFNIASTGGNVQLTVPHPAGDMITTTTAAWSATDATYLSNIQTVLDVATGVTNGIVVSAITSVDTDLGFLLTYSGTGYAGLPQPMASVYGTLPTSTTTWNAIRVTGGSNGAFVTGSIIQPTDGSETPLTFINEINGGTVVTDTNGNNIVVPFDKLPIGGEVDAYKIINWPADPSLRIWLMQSLSTVSGGKFTFGEIY
jgi:hypothetical protein